MTLTSGSRLGAYEIVTLLGAGGMGEVYRAHDGKLGRDVAIKVLPDLRLTDPDRRARFEREARVLASLNHPHIGAIYGVEEAGGIPALVLELVEGETLAELLTGPRDPKNSSSGQPLRIDVALQVARQIADGLDAAHEKGIVHRDLKPANVKITPEGTVKILDFGLAREGVGDTRSELSRSPTMTSGGTRDGVLLGTAAYMSPEQARARPVDKRTDIWAFGCVVYEMLTGRAPFARETLSDTLAAILDREPDWTALPATTPANVKSLLERCLAKDPKLRLRDIGDARMEIAGTASSTIPAEEGAGRSGSWTTARWSAALVVTALASGILAWNLKPASPLPSPASSTVARLAIAPPPGDLLAVDVAAIALSPDGRYVAYVAGRGSRRRIFLRGIDDFNSTPLPGTEGGINPFFSPDGQWIGFFTNGKIKKVIRRGGSLPVTMADATTAGSASWEADDSIYFTPNLGAGIWRIPAAGGTPTPVTKLAENEQSHRWPQLLANGKALLFSAATASPDGETQVLSLGTGQRKLLVKGAARYLPTGHLVYLQAGTVLAVPFDVTRLEVTGTPVAVFSGVMQVDRLRNSSIANLIPQICFSNAGTMAFVPTSAPARRSQLVWVDRTGAEQPTGAIGGSYFQPRLSPDGRQLSVTVGGDHDDVWLFNLSRQTWSRMTSGGNNSFGLWSPDGRTLTHVSDKAGHDNIFWKPLDGARPDEPLLTTDRPNYPFSWSRDGALAYVSVETRTAQDIWVFRPDRKEKPIPFLQTSSGEGAPTFSPDGRWLAYVSNESGRNEIYVRPFPGPGEAVTISTEGGNEPVWPANVGEMFYRSGDAMMAVEIATGLRLTVGKPRRLFEQHYEPTLALWPNYTVTPDGRRFVMVKRIDEEASAQINVVLNWFDELQRLVPSGRGKP